MLTRYAPSESGPLLLTRQWARMRPEAHVFVGHTQPTHSGSLCTIAESFQARGCAVFSGDLRGHGFSTDGRHPRGHLPRDSGWDELISDMERLLDAGFMDIAWEDRVIVAPNICALLVIELLKRRPDLARDIVLVSPVPNQHVMPKLGRAFIRARMMFKPPDEPDEQTLHHLYSFLGAHLGRRNHIADVISGDPSVIESIVSDPNAWPTPTLSYWWAIFDGMARAWRWPGKARLREGTRFLILYGSEDAMMRDGAFAPAVREVLEEAGAESVDLARIEGGRSGLILDEARLGVAERIMQWRRGARIDPGEAPAAADFQTLSAEILAAMGEGKSKRLRPEELVELCYGAIDDEERWVEALYRAAFTVAHTDSDSGAADVERVFAEVMPHWERSFQLNRQVMMSATLGVLLQHVVERLEIGVALLDGSHKPLHFNDSLVQSLARAKGVDADGVDAAAVAAAVKPLVEDCLRRDPSGDGEKVVVRDGRPIGLYCRPAALRLAALQRGGPAGLLILRDPEEPPLRDDQRAPLVELAYGLTRQEALVALRIASGSSPEGAAEEMGVSINTIRTHLRRCYEKMGVDGQTGMVSRLMSGPLGWLSAR